MEFFLCWLANFKVFIHYCQGLARLRSSLKRLDDLEMLQHLSLFLMISLSVMNHLDNLYHLSHVTCLLHHSTLFPRSNFQLLEYQEKKNHLILVPSFWHFQVRKFLFFQVVVIPVHIWLREDKSLTLEACKSKVTFFLDV